MGLESLPNSIGELQSIEDLFLYGNKFVNLPEYVA